MTRRMAGLAGLLSFTGLVACAAMAAGPHGWTADELDEIRGLWIGALEDMPADPSNRFASDSAAATLGRQLFFDPRLSGNGAVSCATCHVPEREFQDDVPLATGVGRTNRRTMPIAATAHAPFLFWDGRKDSQWSQALGPLENPVEHGGTRAQYAHVVAENYRSAYESVFGALPALDDIPRVAGPVADQSAADAWRSLTQQQRDDVTAVFVNIGKAIAAFERQVRYGASRFDRYAEALVNEGRAPDDVLTPDEIAGLRIFIGKGNCIQCHNGPLLTNNEFHNTGVPAVPGLPSDDGRLLGARQVLSDEFNCRSTWSDAAPGECAELEFLVLDGHELERAYKVPSLRNVADRAPYMHAGQIATLGEVVQHYDRAPEAPGGHTELKRLKLNGRERRQLEAYLRALSGGIIAPADNE